MEKIHAGSIYRSDRQMGNSTRSASSKISKYNPMHGLPTVKLVIFLEMTLYEMKNGHD